ncbi:MAG: hypothetical protein HY826_00535 [Actinobacteria bacterium]|nr:hypothetical protein [Actinomycetota bacterium]
MPAATTTIRIDREVHARLVRLAAASGQPLINVVSDAAEALERSRFAARVGREIATLQADNAAWTSYLADTELAAGDGVT